MLLLLLLIVLYSVYITFYFTKIVVKNLSFVSWIWWGYCFV